MKPADFRFLEGLRVRWAEVDLQKIVFNGHYLMYFDTAVAGYWRALALPYHETMAALGGDLFVRKATLEYRASARYDEQLRVGIRCARIGRSSMGFEAAAFRGGQCLVHGELVYVFADPATQRSQPVPAALRAVLEAYEAGEPTIDVVEGPWGEAAAAVRELRRSVFVDELGLGAAFVEDAADAQALHVWARNRLGVTVAAGRLLDGAPQQAEIGRLATLPGLRGAQLGRAVLRRLLDGARARQARSAWLHAQVDAQGFYERMGFIPEGAAFEAAGLQHQTLRRPL